MEPAKLKGLQERLRVDTSEARPVYLLVVGNGSYLRLSSSAYHLLRQIGEGASYEQIAEAIGRQQGQPVPASAVEEAYRKLTERIEKIEKEPKKLPFGYWVELKLFGAERVRRISSRLALAFHRPVALGLLSLVAMATTALLVSRGLPRFQPEAFAQGYALFFLSLLAHEFGHSSACARYGAQPSDIGFTVYLIYPALYSDVSAAWQLKRWQRVVVDLGGLYFQLVVGACYALAWLVWGAAPLGNALLMIGGSCLFSLNPIFKFDGYWVVADALGVTNLAQQPGRIARHVLDRLRGRPVQPLPWPGAITGVLSVYTVISFSVWGLFLRWVGPVAWEHATRYPQLLEKLRAMLVQQPLQVDGRLVHQWLGSTSLLLISCFTLVRLLRTVGGGLRRLLFKPASPAASPPAPASNSS